MCTHRFECLHGTGPQFVPRPWGERRLAWLWAAIDMAPTRTHRRIAARFPLLHSAAGTMRQK